MDEGIQKMKSCLNGFAYTVFILGCIGSCILAYYCGIQEYGSYYTYYDRNWALTIGIFAGCFISTTVISIILWGLVAVLTNQEKIIKEYNETLTSIQVCQDKIAEVQKQITTNTIVESTEQ